MKFYYAFARSVEEKVKVLVCASYSLVMNSYPIPYTPKKLKKGANYIERGLAKDSPGRSPVGSVY